MALSYQERRSSLPPSLCTPLSEKGVMHTHSPSRPRASECRFDRKRETANRLLRSFHPISKVRRRGETWQIASSTLLSASLLAPPHHSAAVPTPFLVIWKTGARTGDMDAGVLIALKRRQKLDSHKCGNILFLKIPLKLTPQHASPCLVDEVHCPNFVPRHRSRSRSLSLFVSRDAERGAAAAGR